MSEYLIPKGVLRGHTDVVTAVATPIDNFSTIVSSSRDNSIIIWNLTKDSASNHEDPSTATYGVPKRHLTGHSDFVQDVVLSSDGKLALSGSWDGELRLWDLNTGKTMERFVGHATDVMSVAFSVDDKQIVSGSRDRTIKLWDISGYCKHTINKDGDGHTNWVSCVRVSPNNLQQTMISASWDQTVKVWSLTNCKIEDTLTGHNGFVNTVAISPDGTLCASGGKDGVMIIWDLENRKAMWSLENGAVIHALCFCPSDSRYWVCAATLDCIKIWDLESKSVVQDLNPSTASVKPGKNQKMLYCTSMAWSSDGNTLFAGYTDGTIRVWEISGSTLF